MTSKPSTSRKRDDGQFDLEQQFILRMPPAPSEALRRDVEAGSMNLKDKLTIELKPDHKKGSLRYGDYVFNAKLVNLPTIIESLKTTDRKNFYKTADISQMLICQIEDYSSDDEAASSLSPKKYKDKEKRYTWNHGLTLPLKNVKKRRFRKTLRKKYQEQPDIEKEVKRLFRMDNEAIEVKWEVVEDEDLLGISGADTSGGPNASGHILADGSTNNDTFATLGEHELFGDMISSDDEDDEEEEDERDINIMDPTEDVHDNSPSTQLSTIESTDAG